MSTYRNTPLWRAFDKVTGAVDRRVGWDRLPKPIGLLILLGVRNRLRRENLYDTSTAPTAHPVVQAPPADPGALAGRSADGSWNNLDNPTTGMAGTRFGRNIPPSAVRAEGSALLEPNPRVVSRRLMTRDQLIPATAGNALIAGWLQFMIHDWFSHGTSPTDNPWTIALDVDDDWPAPQVTVMPTPADPSAPAGASPATFVNTLTHWWDASQVYGKNLKEQEFLREHKQGKLRLENGHQPIPPPPAPNPTLQPGFWVGFAMLSTLFAREHNSICDMLAETHPEFDEETLFQKARLINAAVTAKIHTVEWTPAVTAHPTAAAAVRANWYGLAGQRLHDRFGRLSRSEVISGILGTPTDDHGVPFSLTEEFVAVYRMHPLIPDRFDFRSAADDRPTLGPREFNQLTGSAGVEVLAQSELADLIYTFATMNPGLVTLHNYPKHLQTFVRPDTGEPMDLAATDILRSRETGVPRYAEFRRLFHLTVPRSFSDITSNAAWADELRDVYGEVDKVDLMTGMYAEDRPKGFAFSDTAFRVFALMAARRLNSDRFFTTHFTEGYYTREGMKWIRETTMGTVLKRHCPTLGHLVNKTNAFALWDRAGAT